MKTLLTWIADIYKTHGYIAALVTIVVLLALALAVSLLTGIGIGDIVKWVDMLTYSNIPFLGGIILGVAARELKRK
jgi:phosphotransferase system  glucose/maltose/N-acetylglucosamine-specific IIC component